MRTAKSAGVKSLRLALDTLEEIAAADDEIGISELAKRLGVAKGSLFRHLQTLVTRGYLQQNAQTARYRLGIKARLLGQLSAGQGDLLSASRDIQKELSERIGQTVVVSVVAADTLTVLATHLAPSPVEIGVRPGSRLSLHASAQGKVILAFSRRLSLLQLENRRLRRLTNHTLAKWKALSEEIALVARRGWATAPEEVYLGINGLAAPLFDASEDCIGAIALVGLIQQIPREPHPNQVQAVLDAAQRLSSRLGYDKAPSPRQDGAGKAKAAR